jgi:hypothetical protein
MKALLIFAALSVLLSCGESSSQQTKPADSAATAAAAKPAAPYTLPVPDGWTTEQFPIPIEFAPQIPYKGVEDLRFTPGWGDTTSAQHWSYCFLWWLEGNPSPDAAALQQHLTDYYNGLVGRNIPKRNIPTEKQVTTKVSITKDATAANDQNTYTGTIYMLNYLKQQPITLHCRIHERKCGGNRTALFFEISPQEFNQPVWEAYKKILSGFTCSQ